MDLPCSRRSLWLHAGGTNPGSTASHSQCCAACDSAFPFAGQGRLLRSRSISGLFSRSLYSGLQPPCLRFAVAVTGHHARLGSRLLARLYRGRHRRRQSSTHLHGATRPDPYVPNSGIRLPPWVDDGETLILRLTVCAPAPVTRFVRFCARPVLCWLAFPSAPALRSTGSAATVVALFVGFPATMAESDFSRPYIIGYGSSPSRCGPAALPTRPSRDLPVPAQGASAHARVSDHAGSSGPRDVRARTCCLPPYTRCRHPG